ncbi:hypothetical protein GUJ93_ZPchr0006g45987 [Zizania palustris]|uniref:Uncharacterized protein n=1 Tax=Zizania palustris TaxID=103762 RepID=A0A8J5TCA6_ZIZPA|nr:hypothetical protein GUJ93_ZPchr0006g45987 [Zizania palustris]
MSWPLFSFVLRQLPVCSAPPRRSCLVPLLRLTCLLRGSLPVAVSSDFCYQPVDSASAGCYNASSWQSHTTASSSTSKAVDLPRILKRQVQKELKKASEFEILDRLDTIVCTKFTVQAKRGTEKVEKFPRQEEDKKVFSMQGHRP